MISAPVAPKIDQDDPMGLGVSAKKGGPPPHADDDPMGLGTSKKTATNPTFHPETVPHETPTQPRQENGPLWGQKAQPTDFQSLFNDAVGLSQKRLPQVIQAATPKAVRNMAREDMFASVRDLQAASRPFANMEANNQPTKQFTPLDILGQGSSGGVLQLPSDVAQKRDQIVANAVDPFTGNAAQIQQKLGNGDPAENTRLIQQIKRDNPAIGTQIDKDAYIVSAKDRGVNAQKILQNAQAIQDGDLQFNHRSGELEKPLGFWGSIAHGWRSADEAKKGYNDMVDGTPAQNIPKLEAMMAQLDPDKPKEVPTGVGTVGEMIGANGLPMAASAVVDAGTTALDNPELAPIINSAIWGTDTHASSWYNSYTNTYQQLRQKGTPQADAEREARNQAEFDSHMDAANAAFATMAAGEATKMGKPSSLLTRGSNQLVYDEAGNFLRKDLPVDPAYQKVLNKIYANTLGDAKTNLGTRILREGGPVAAMAGAGQVAKNVYDNKPWDQNVASATLGQLGLHASLAILGNMGSNIPGVKKENLAPEINPDTEDGAKLFIDSPGESHIDNENRLDEAKKTIAGTPHAEGISSDDDLLHLTRDIAEQAHNPETAEAAKAQYGEPLVNVSKELHPAESFAPKEADITKPLSEQVTPDMTTGEISSLKNNYTAKARNALGMPDVDEPARKEFGTSWDEAGDGIAKGVIKPAELVAEALSKPRPWSDVENAAVLRHQVDTETQLRGVENEINNPTPDTNISDLNAKRVQLRDQLQDIYTAGKKAGTENARGLATRKMLADANYSLASMMDQKKASLGGRDLTDAEKDQVQSAYNDIQDAQEKKQNMTAAGFTADPSASISANAQVQRAQQAFNKSLAQPKTGFGKYADAFVNWQREFKLSNPLTVLKLLGAGVARTGVAPVEQLLGGALGAAPENSWLGQVAKKATSEVGFNIKNESDALTTGFMKGLKDMEDIWKTGKSDLDFIDGKKQMDEDGINFFGKIHKLVKAPVKRIAFERSWRNQVSNLLEQGQNPTDPAIMAQTTIQAMKDANRAIFMQDNLASKGMNNLVNALQRQGKGGELTADALKFLIPFVKVPTNIVGETANYLSIGLPGWYKLIKNGFQGGLSKMEPDEAAFIMRNIKKGSLGLAVTSYAFMHPEDFGGEYRPGAKDQGDLKEGEAKFMGQTIPKLALEAPIVQAAQVAATLRKYIDGHKDGESDLPLDMLATAFGFASNEPLATPLKQWSGFLGNGGSLKKGVGEFVKGTTDPAILQQWARWQQDGTKLKPQGPLLQQTGQSVESGLPYLWKNVPEKGESNSGPTSGHQ